MNINLSEWIKETRGKPRRVGSYEFYNNAARIVCADGFTMSVQASATHYCTPRDNSGPWTEFEVGYPSKREQLLLLYAEQPKHLTDTVYSCVPEDLILAVIKKHGGVKIE